MPRRVPITSPGVVAEMPAPRSIRILATTKCNQTDLETDRLEEMAGGRTEDTRGDGRLIPEAGGKEKGGGVNLRPGWMEVLADLCMEKAEQVQKEVVMQKSTSDMLHSTANRFEKARKIVTHKFLKKVGSNRPSG